MKICFVSTSFIRHVSDGYARFVYDQAKSLLRIDQGYEVVAIAPHAPNLARYEFVDGLRIIRFRYFFPTNLQRLAYQHEGLFNTLKSSWVAAIQLPCFLIAMFFALWRHSKEASVIHAQWLPTAVVAVVAGLLRGIPVCVSVRGADLNSLRKSRWSMWIGRFVLDRTDAVCTVSQEFQEVLRGLELRPPVYALFNGVDTQVFRRRDRTESKQLLKISSEHTLILYVGGLISRKRVSTLLRTFARIKERLPATSRICIAGEGPLKTALEIEALELSIAEKVIFVGRVARNDVALWMAASECLVLPSESEGRPNVVLEAMAVGTPVIATAVNGTVELIRSGHNGLLFEPEDDVTLGQHLIDIFEKPELGRALAAQALATLEAQQLSWEAHGHQLDKIYNKLTKN